MMDRHRHQDRKRRHKRRPVSAPFVASSKEMKLPLAIMCLRNILLNRTRASIPSSTCTCDFIVWRIFHTTPYDSSNDFISCTVFSALHMLGRCDDAKGRKLGEEAFNMRWGIDESWLGKSIPYLTRRRFVILYCSKPELDNSRSLHFVFCER